MVKYRREGICNRAGDPSKKEGKTMARGVSGRLTRARWTPELAGGADLGKAPPAGRRTKELCRLRRRRPTLPLPPTARTHTPESRRRFEKHSTRLSSSAQLCSGFLNARLRRRPAVHGGREPNPRPHSDFGARAAPALHLAWWLQRPRGDHDCTHHRRRRCEPHSF